MLKITYIDTHIVEITLSQAHKRNALSLEMLHKLNAKFIELTQDQQCRCILLKAEGPTFSAGHDLKEINAMREKADGGKAFFNDIFQTCTKLMLTITHSPIPVIACVNGIATAAGCQLVATCDLAFATPHAQFATPGVNIGLFCSTPMVALSRCVGTKKAMEMLLTGDLYTAQDALQSGLINAIYPEKQFDKAVMDLAKKIVQKPYHTIKTGKIAFYKQIDMPLQDAYTYTGQVMLENLMHKDAIEGIQNFVDKKTKNT